MNNQFLQVRLTRLSQGKCVGGLLAVAAAVFKFWCISYGCSETTTSPDQLLVVPLQLTVVELA